MSFLFCSTVKSYFSGFLSHLTPRSLIIFLGFEVKKDLNQAQTLKTDGTVRAGSQVAPCLQTAQRDYRSNITNKRLATVKKHHRNFKSVRPLVILNPSAAPFISCRLLRCLRGQSLTYKQETQPPWLVSSYSSQEGFQRVTQTRTHTHTQKHNVSGFIYLLDTLILLLVDTVSGNLPPCSTSLKKSGNL